jgi:hypothetical protein
MVLTVSGGVKIDVGPWQQCVSVSAEEKRRKKALHRGGARRIAVLSQE